MSTSMENAAVAAGGPEGAPTLQEVGVIGR